jgi:hypothetical protein
VAQQNNFDVGVVESEICFREKWKKGWKEKSFVGIEGGPRIRDVIWFSKPTLVRKVKEGGERRG